jgi:hypothetical protein
MYELFELVRLLSVRRQSTRQGPVEISQYAWKENGESSFLALLCSNGMSVNLVGEIQCLLAF